MVRNAVIGLLAAAGMEGAAHAGSDTPQSVRLVGEAPGAADPAPARFVLDLQITPGDSAFQSEVKGWYAALPPADGSGAVEGQCVRRQCAVSVDLDAGKLSLTGDLDFPATASAGRWASADSDGEALGEGDIRLAPITGPVADLGVLAAPGAVSARELRTLLLWSDISQGFDNSDDTEPGDGERDGLASWQQSQSKPMTGLIFEDDLAALRAHAEAAKTQVGWTVVGDDKQGWSAGYPAKLLPVAGQANGQRHFASGDGRASLTIAVEPPISQDQFSQRVDELTHGGANRSNQNYTAVNNDLVLSYTEDGVAVSGAYHNRDDKLVWIEFRRPAGEDQTWALYDTLLPDSLEVRDAGP